MRAMRSRSRSATLLVRCDLAEQPEVAQDLPDPGWVDGVACERVDLPPESVAFGLQQVPVRLLRSESGLYVLKAPP